MFNKQILIYAGIAILILILLRSIIYAFKGKPEDNSGSKNSITSNVGSNINKETTEATMTQSQYDVIADALENAMDGVGTDDDMVKACFAKMVTRMDVLRVIQAFGVRDGETLGEWLESDGANDEANEVLKANVVDFRF